jgi:Flp pilus assembly protein TadD
MQGPSNFDIAEALALHRKGFISEAKAIYEEAVLINENDANAIGLLGIVAIQEGNRTKAEMLWRQSISLESDPFIYLRNL